MKKDLIRLGITLFVKFLTDIGADGNRTKRWGGKMENTARNDEGFGFIEEDTQKDKYLTFSLAEEVYAIDICYVTEIIGILKITKVPDMPPFHQGCNQFARQGDTGHGYSGPV